MVYLPRGQWPHTVICQLNKLIIVDDLCASLAYDPSMLSILLAMFVKLLPICCRPFGFNSNICFSGSVPLLFCIPITNRAIPSSRPSLKPPIPFLTMTSAKFVRIVPVMYKEAVTAGRRAKGDIRPGRHCAVGGIWRGKIWNSEIWPLLVNTE